MQTDRLKRFRACAGGWGVSTRMAASARSSQMRAMLWAADATLTTPNPAANSKANREIFANANREGLFFKLSIFTRLPFPAMELVVCFAQYLANVCTLGLTADC